MNESIQIHICKMTANCEHKWDGEISESDDGRGYSATCSKCGIDAMHESLFHGETHKVK